MPSRCRRRSPAALDTSSVSGRTPARQGAGPRLGDEPDPNPLSQPPHPRCIVTPAAHSVDRTCAERRPRPAIPLGRDSSSPFLGRASGSGILWHGAPCRGTWRTSRVSPGTSSALSRERWISRPRRLWAGSRRTGSRCDLCSRCIAAIDRTRAPRDRYRGISAIGINSARGHQHQGDTHAQHAVTTRRSLGGDLLE